MSFLSRFKTVLHAMETAAAIAAPVVAAVDPAVGALIKQAVAASIGVETAVTTPGTGAQKAAIVAAQTKATVDVVNSILVSEGKKPLPANVTDVVATQVGVVVSGLNVVAAVETPAAA